MSADLPPIIANKLIDISLEKAPIAYLSVSKQGILLDAAGDLAAFDLEALQIGSSANAQILFLEAMLPLEGKSLTIPSMEIGDGRYADIHLLSVDEHEWVILVDTSRSLRWKALAQQKANELQLLRQQIASEKADAVSEDASHQNVLESYCHALHVLALAPNEDGSYQLLGTPATCFFPVYPEIFNHQHSLHPDITFPFVKNFLVDAKDIWQQTEGSKKSGVWIEVDHSGTEHALEATAATWRNQNILVIELLGERYEKERSLLQKARECTLEQQMLENSERIKSEFLSYMSHEFRTPLNAVMGYGQMLEVDENIPHTQKEWVKEILGASRHLLEIINELLDLARVESGKMDFSIARVNCDELLSGCLSLVKSQADQRGINLQYQEGQGRDIVVLADAVRIKQVLLNLLSNAIKYNAEAGIVDVQVALVKDNDTVRITVTDTGRGISAKHQSELFQPYNRFDVGKSGIEGTGIGLMISKQLVELMNGTIGVESRVRKGSSFWIEMPAVSLV